MAIRARHHHWQIHGRRHLVNTSVEGIDILNVGKAVKTVANWVMFAVFGLAAVLFTTSLASAEPPILTTRTEIGVSCANSRVLMATQVGPRYDENHQVVGGVKEDLDAGQRASVVVAEWIPRVKIDQVPGLQRTVYQTDSGELGIAVSDPDSKEKVIAALHFADYDGFGMKLQRGIFCD